MTFLELILIGVGLSMDAAAVSISNALAYPRLSRRAKCSMPVLFGLFQGLMPMLGYAAGGLCAYFIQQYAGYVTFFILAFIGGKMILDALHCDGEGPCAPKFTLRVVVMQAVATSIDAFAVGVGLCAVDVSLWLAVPVIALTTFFCCCAALLLGRRFGRLLGAKATIFGGLILVLIGIKALFV